MKRTTKHHECSQMACPRAHSEFNSGIPPEWNHGDAKGSQHYSHSDIRYFWWIDLSTLKIKSSIVSGEQSDESDDHFTQGWVNIEIELAFEVMGGEFSKVCFIPDDKIGGTDVVKTSPAGQEGVDDGGEVFEILEKKLALEEKDVNQKQGMQLKRPTMEVAGGGGGCGIRPLAIYGLAFRFTLA